MSNPIEEDKPAPPVPMVVDQSHWVGCKACGGYGIERCKECGKVDPECECADNPWDDCSVCGGTSYVWDGPTN